MRYERKKLSLQGLLFIAVIGAYGSLTTERISRSVAHSDGMYGLKYCGDRINYDPFCLNSLYDSYKPPKNNRYIEVDVWFDLTEFYELDDFHESVDFKLKVYLAWIDPMIYWLKRFEHMDRTNVDIDALYKIWTPTLSVERLKDFTNVDVLTHHGSLITLDFEKIPDSSSENYDKVKVHYGFEARIKMACAMDFSNFPFDTQSCLVKIYPPDFNDCLKNNTDDCRASMRLISRYSDKILGNWNGSFTDPALQLQNFEVTTSNVTESDHTKAVYNAYGDKFTHSATGFNIIFRRKFESYKMKYYMPCGAAVAASLVSFLIPPDSVPGRTGLLVTLFLVTITIFKTILEKTPHSGGLTGLSYFAMVSIFYIAGAILEYAVLLYLKRRVAFRTILNSTRIGKMKSWNLTDDKKEKSGSIFWNIDLFCYKMDRFFFIVFLMTYLVYVIQLSIKNHYL